MHTAQSLALLSLYKSAVLLVLFGRKKMEISDGDKLGGDRRKDKKINWYTRLVKGDFLLIFLI